MLDVIDSDTFQSRIFQSEESITIGGLTYLQASTALYDVTITCGRKTIMAAAAANGILSNPSLDFNVKVAD